ncbi:type IV toxin-antitoxin system AbiEi family antitoxin [Curtobacterium sp. MCBA15_004]|uniref:type IV toxin-antitoxin system AbiEi family antitoxin n=1 Tax=Curtobacterium sp. SAFR-003 TaxID=3387276 RepID=UPI0011147CEC
MNAETHGIVREVEERLRVMGLDISASGQIDGVQNLGIWDAELQRRDTSWRRPVLAAIVPSMTLSSYDQIPWPAGDGRPRLLIGPRVTTQSADRFRALGVNFVDTVGNAFIRDEALLIDVRRPGGAAVSTASAPGDVNLFSIKRSQVLFALLTWPGLVDAPLRRIAEASGVSIGLAKEVVDHLSQRSGDVRDLWPGGRSRDRFVDQWVAAFPSGLGASRRTRRFVARTLDVGPADGVQIAVSGERGAPWIRSPETLSVWVRPWDPMVAVRNRWRSIGEPNVFVREMFWRAPSAGDASITLAPPLLVFAELMAMNDSRAREAAEEVRSRTGLVDA